MGSHLAFFGFLRLGEMTCNSPYSCTLHLSPGDVTFFPSFQNPEHMSVRIKISKTDPFRSGQSIVIGKTDQRVCPVLAMTNYLSYWGPQQVHFFSTCLGLPSQKRALPLKLGSFSVCQVFNPLSMRDIAIELGLPQPLLLWAFPLG